MKNLFEIDGFYGASKNEAVIFVYEKSNGSKWYCVENSCNVNLTYDEIQERLLQFKLLTQFDIELS